MRDGLKSLEKLEKRIVSGVENLILCVLLWEDLPNFLLKLSFCPGSLYLKYT